MDLDVALKKAAPYLTHLNLIQEHLEEWKKLKDIEQVLQEIDKLIVQAGPQLKTDLTIFRNALV